MRKLTIGYIKEQFEKEGYELLTEIYENAHQKLDYICPNGHKYYITWGSWKQGCRCSYCACNIKLTIEFIRSEFAKEGYELLTETYENAHQKLEYICPSGHKHSISWSSWQRGCRCAYCLGVDKLVIEFIRSEFAKEGYELLTEIYENAHQKLDYICPNGHKHSISWGHWQQGSRCYYCNGNIKPTVEFIKSEFVKEGYTLLTTVYENAYQKLDYICSRGHKHSIAWSDWKRGNRCFYCANLDMPSIDFIKNQFEREGYVLLTKVVKNSKQKIDYICINGHKHSICWNHWQQGQRCPYCYGNISRGEVEVRNFTESLGIKVLPNNKNQIFNPETGYSLELDIFMPILNKAIEYNGEYWHRNKSRDLLKQKLCELKGIDLLIIWDKEWKMEKDICRDKIKKFIFEKEKNYVRGT